MPYWLNYFRQLSQAKQMLWCYLIWYVTMVMYHFDPSPHLWITSLGISAVIGFGLILSVSNANNQRDFWTTTRLFLMPFCVSSFSALIKDQGFVLILSPLWRENAVAIAGCILFLLLVNTLQRLLSSSSYPAQ